MIRRSNGQINSLQVAEVAIKTRPINLQMMVARPALSYIFGYMLLRGCCIHFCDGL